jgi:hypothetical protein
MCAALAPWWLYAGVLSEVAVELQQALDSGAGSRAERAWVLTTLAKLSQLIGFGPDSRALTDQALAEWGAVEDEVERALGLGHLTWVIRWDARYDQAIAIADEALAVLRRTGDRRLILRGLVFLAHAYADPQDVEHTEAVLREADELADGDPVWELAAIHGDIAEYSGDPAGALAWFSESLAWSSTTGESHQMLMDMTCIALALARLGRDEDALESAQLVRLERERTGRSGDLPTSHVWFQEAVTAVLGRLDPESAQRAVARAREVPVTSRAAHAIEIANRVIASAT